MLDVYNKRIMDLVPNKENLLVMKVGDWEPLCKFLEKPIPNVPFPRVNGMYSERTHASSDHCKIITTSYSPSTCPNNLYQAVANHNYP